MKDEPFAVWMSQGLGISLFGVERMLGYLSGGFEGRIAESKPVEEDGEQMIDIEIVPFDPQAEVVFKLTRDGPLQGE
jgi:hypothetical protein